MPIKPKNKKRTVAPIHGKKNVKPDPPFERDLSKHLRASYTPAAFWNTIPVSRRAMANWIV